MICINIRKAIIIIAFYFLYFDPRISFMKQSQVFEDIEICEQARLKTLDKIKSTKEFWISPSCEQK